MRGDLIKLAQYLTQVIYYLGDYEDQDTQTLLPDAYARCLCHENFLKIFILIIARNQQVVTTDALLSTNNSLGRPGQANLIYYLLQASTDERKRFCDK